MNRPSQKVPPRLRPQRMVYSSFFFLLIVLLICIYFQWKTFLKAINVDSNFDNHDYDFPSFWTINFKSSGINAANLNMNSSSRVNRSIIIKNTPSTRLPKSNVYQLDDSRSVPLAKHSDEAKESEKEHEQGMAACILTKDDNPLWPEWLAYHYQVLPLRRLIVAVDPASRTSPHSILNRYAENGLPLNVTIWENDEFIGPNSSTPEPDLFLRLQNMTYDSIQNYLSRQLLFMKACLKELYFENRSWVLLTDTDEYLVPQLMKTNTKEAPNMTFRIENTTQPPFFQPNETILSAFNRNAKESSTALVDYFADDKCIRVGRRRFLNYEKNSTRIEAGNIIDSQLEQNKTIEAFFAAPYLSTIFQTESIYQYNVKSLLNMRKLSEKHVSNAFFNGKAYYSQFNPHSGLQRACGSAKKAVRERRHSAQSDALLINHYGKSLKEVFLRGDVRSTQIDQFERELTKSRKEAVRESPEQIFRMRQWISSFVDNVGGVDIAWNLLKPSEVV